MAIVEETIGSGKDRASPTVWEANVGVFGTDTYKGIIQEDAEHGAVTLTGSTGTPSVTSYLWLTSDPANRHAGVAGTGHARIRNASAGTHCVTLDSDWVRVEGLEIQQDSTGDSDEAIRANNSVVDALVQSCILWTDTGTSAQDGAYTGTAVTSRVSFDNIISYGWPRAAFHIQITSAANTVEWDIDHCAWFNSGTDATSESGGLLIRNAAGGTATIIVTVYNSWGLDCENGAGVIDEPFSDQQDNLNRDTPDATTTWHGTHNAMDFATRDDIAGTDNTTNWQDCTDGGAVVTKSTGSWIVVVNLTAGSENLLLLDEAAGNLLAGNGTNRQGSENDARQDFSVDITGGARPTTGVDIGPHQFAAAAPDGLPPRHRQNVYHQSRNRRRSQVFA